MEEEKGKYFTMSGASTPPKITFFTLPTKRPETPGMATPPLRPPGGVPFIWEEAPGKPKVKREPRLPPGPVAKSLDPPPRKVAEMKVINVITSPTNVLDGPYVNVKASSFGEGRSRSLSFRFLSSSSFSNKKGDKNSHSFREKERKRRISVGVLDPESSTPSSSSSSSSSSCVFYPLSNLSSSSQYCDDEVVSEERIKGQEGKETKVTISRMRRSRSFQSISLHASSNFWAWINGGMKKHWPWRRSHNKA